MVRASRYHLKKKAILDHLGDGWRRRSMDIDVLIPTTGKDSTCLRNTIEAARKYLRHRIQGIYLVYDERPKLAALPSPNDLILLNEREIAPIDRSRVIYKPRGVDRSGWLYQQLIKLSCDEICRTEHILALDADTVLTRPQRLIVEGKVVFSVSDERYQPYYAMIERLLPGTPIFPFSFVSHHMMFKKEHLRELKKTIQLCGKKWFEAILEKIDPDEVSGFSEYELYGNYVMSRHPDGVRVEHSLNQGFSARRIARLWYIKLRHPLIKSASFHKR